MYVTTDTPKNDPTWPIGLGGNIWNSPFIQVRYALGKATDTFTDAEKSNVGTLSDRGLAFTTTGLNIHDNGLEW